MKSILRFNTLWLSVLALLGMAVGFAAQAQSPKPARYSVVDLGTLGGTYSFAYGLNDASVVAGGSATPIQAGGITQTAFLWDDGSIINLDTLGGSACPGCSSEAGGLNASGESALLSETANPDPNNEDFCGFGTHLQCLAATWKNGTLGALPTLPGGNNAQAYWLNNRGQVVGFAENGHRETPGYCAYPFQVLDFEAVIWEPNGDARELKPLRGDMVGFAFGINDKGQVVGSSGLCSNVTLPPNFGPNAPHAVLWEKDGSVHDLGNLGGTTNNVATGVNNRGEVIGNSPSSQDGNIHPFLWTKKNGIRDLGAFPGAVATIAPCCHVLNDRDQVVGFWIDGRTGNFSAFLWQEGAFTDLNTLIPASSPLFLLQALSINDAGEIVGFGVNSAGELHGFLATPCDGNDDEAGCSSDEIQGAATDLKTTDGTRPVLSERARELLQRKLGFGRLGAQLMARQ